jgi:hypothetical protein
MIAVWIVLLLAAAACFAAVLYIGTCAVEEGRPANNETRTWRRRDWEG